MRALSIKQPWAELIASGVKTIETRTWATKYRGPLLICSGLCVDATAHFASIDLSKLEYGMAVASADLVGCRPMAHEDESDAKCEWTDGRFAWVLQNVHRIEVPFAVRGQLGLFNVENPYSREGVRYDM